MIRRRGLGKPTKAMACVSAKMLATSSIAEVSASRKFASYHSVGRALGVVLNCRPSVFAMFSRCPPSAAPDAGVSHGIATLRDIIVG
jgi:hypothetical protein